MSAFVVRRMAYRDAAGCAMTRAENVALAQELRAQGLRHREIAERFDVSITTAHSWLSDPDLAKQRARKASYSTPCPECGKLASGSEGRRPGHLCRDCGLAAGGQRIGEIRRAAAEPRYRLIERRWQDGQTLKQIADELGTTVRAIAAVLHRLRQRDGYSLPYRRTPEQVARIKAARWPA